MLLNIRNNIQGKAAKVIIAIIVVPFAFFGIDSLFQTGSTKPAAEVNGEEVSEADVAQSLAMQKRRLIGMMGDQIDPAMLDDAVLRKPALNTLIKQSLMLQAAEAEGITVSKQQLDATIAAMPQFHENNRFSQARYEQILRLQGYSSAMFKQLLKSDLILQQLSTAVAGSAFVTEAQLERVVELVHETRTYHYIPVPVANFENQVQIDNQDINAFYEASPQRFQSPEKVKLSYLELEESQFYKPVSEEKVQAEYQRIVASAQSQTEREAAHILVEITDERSREEAVARLKEVRQKLSEGADFSAVAKEVSEDAGSASQGGVLGYTSGDSFPAEFEDALAGLQVGEISQVVETDAGVHLIKLTDIRSPDTPSLEASRSEITERLRRQEARPRLIAAVEELKDLVFNAENLTMPAKKMNLELKHSDWLSRGSDNELFSVPTIQQAAFDENLRSQSLNSDVFEVSPERYVVVHIEDYAAPSTLPLTEVSDKIRMILADQKARELAKQAAEQIKAELARGGSAEEVAKRNELKWEAVLAGKRSDPAVDAPIRSKAFALARPDDSTSVALVEKDQSWVIVQLLDVSLGELASLAPETLKETREAIISQQAGRDFSAYFGSLWNNAEIEIN